MDRSKFESVIEGLWNYCNYHKIFMVAETQLEIDGEIVCLKLNSTGICGSLGKGDDLMNFTCHNYQWDWNNLGKESQS
ncbi:MAG: hypothetical protein V7K88_28745 [Nostoc sp.]|uniref:hypothetical protein n=1 Tax=Nostoc sp. TaxID=1180 RepID=UPI002FF997BE